MGRYSTIPYRKVGGKTVTATSIYPEVAASEEDYYIMTTVGDRFDILSKQFYGSSEYWWVIACANPGVRKDTLAIAPGLQLRIPPFKVAKNLYETVNKSR